jgi:ParB family chromosome partitioning protein
MVKNSGLGKGLDALFSQNSVLKEINEKKDEGEKIENIKLTDIEPNPNQARKKFSEESLEELATSIKHYGVLQPIIVENKGKYYQIIAGERRWRAAKKAGLKTIPCLIRDEDVQTTKEISLIENIQRENLNPIEKALGYKELIDNYNLKQQDLADKLGISRTYVTNTLRILNLDPRVIELALEGKLTEGHCKTLVAIENPEQQYAMALKIIESGGTVRDLERSVKNKKKATKKNVRNEAIYRDIEDSFEHFFGTKVQLKAGPRSGSIVIKYSSNEELERILDMIKKGE